MMKQGNRSHPGCPEHIRAGRAPRTSAASMPRWVHSARVPEAGLSGYSWQSPGRTPGRLLTVTPNCAAGLRITLPPSSRSSLDPDGEIARQPRLLALPPRTMESINEIASANSPSEQRHLPHPQLGPTRVCCVPAGWILYRLMGNLGNSAVARWCMAVTTLCFGSDLRQWARAQQIGCA